MSKISIICPCFNEEEVIEEYYSQIKKISKELESYDIEYIVVNDASTDRSAIILDKIARHDEKFKVLHLAANVGHQLALFAGIEAADGDYQITIDIDLQDPPEEILKIVKKLEEGYEIVNTKRINREGESIFKLFSANFFYKLLSSTSSVKLINNSGDFKGFTRQVKDAIVMYKEKHKYLRGIFATIGFNQTCINYNRNKRHAGKTKYSLTKMLILASDAMINFSSFPIKLMLLIASGMWGLGLVYLAKALISKFFWGTTVDGWTSIIFLQVFFSGIILFFIALLGIYIGKIYEQGKNRPDYIIRYSKNINKK